MKYIGVFGRKHSFYKLQSISLMLLLPAGILFLRRNLRQVYYVEASLDIPIDHLMARRENKIKVKKGRENLS